MRLQNKQLQAPNSEIKYFGVLDGFGQAWVRSYRVTFRPATTITEPCDTREQAERETIAAGHKLKGMN